jgi:hypothetical protein
VTTPWQRELRDFLVVALYVVLAGPLVGLIWSSIGPKVDLLPALAGSGVGWKAEAGADAHFGLLCLGAGAICAAIAVACRRDGPGAVAGLAVGGLGAAFTADRVGYLLNHGDTLDVLRAHSVPLSLLTKYGIDPFFKVRALGVVAAWPIAAVTVYMAALGIRDRGRRSLP